MLRGLLYNGNRLLQKWETDMQNPFTLTFGRSILESVESLVRIKIRSQNESTLSLTGII